NILSGHYARTMGLPIHRLVLAANENNVLDEFFRTGIYTPRGGADTYATSSPSMDISKASNLERFIFDLLDRDPAQLAHAWSTPDATVTLALSAHLRRLERELGIVSGPSTQAVRVATIRRVHVHTGVMVGPHPADGVFEVQSYVTAGEIM